MNEWKIQSRSNVCQHCGQKFADKQVYHTMLFEEKSNLSRLDVCDSCWQSQFAHGANYKKGFISYWQGIYTIPPAPQEPIKKETAETLLRKLIELNDPNYSAAIFIIAVMLERKKILKVKEELRLDSKRVFVYEHSKTGDVFSVADPELQLTQLEEIQKNVSALLKFGLPETEAMKSIQNQPAPVSTTSTEPTPLTDATVQVTDNSNC